jgi:hypothetical protein
VQAGAGVQTNYKGIFLSLFQLIPKAAIEQGPPGGLPKIIGDDSQNIKFKVFLPKDLSIKI